MTVKDLYAQLVSLIEEGKGERIVRMGAPTTSDYAEVTGLWIPDDEPVVDLESAEWSRSAKEEL